MVSTEFIAVGANRQPHASDYRHDINQAVFGANRTIAVWDIESNRVQCTIKGHERMVTAVKYINSKVIVSGSQDATLKLWSIQGGKYECIKTLEGHTKSITALFVHDNLIISGSADGTIKFWKYSENDTELVDTKTIHARFYLLCIAAHGLATGSLAVAVGGTQNHIYVFVNDPADQTKFNLEATLEGHENWVKSLSFTETTNDILLASASQDRYIRLWRFHKGDVDSIEGRTAIETDIVQLLANKAYYIDNKQYSVTFEALIMGHDDWVFSVQWHPTKLQLLSSSADSSAIIWHPDESSGVWVGLTRLGDLSIKGSSTATGSSGGFWNAMWIGENSVTAVGRTGSWRKWSFVDNQWKTQLGLSGNVRESTGISWEDGGKYLLSTSLDQTTRLFSKWNKTGRYHEMSRPQIHGYDMVTIQSITPTVFVSGGDEKILRVFEEPKGIAYLLENVSELKNSEKDKMAQSAVVPVLGLSNKQEQEADNANNDNDNEDRNVENIFAFLSELDQPPFEDHLQRLTLWPEIDKLYGHGYEMSCLAVSHDKSLIATCCKANSEKHAVVRLYDTKTWLQLPDPLAVHSLTITSVQFSPDDRFLLTVSRDRTWTLWSRTDTGFEMHHHEPKGHSRIIWDCSWVDNTTFVTAGRDKTVKLWKFVDESWKETSVTKFSAPVTAVDVLNHRLVVGLDTGIVALLKVENDKISMEQAVPQAECPDLRVAKVSWKPDGTAFAVASDDCSVRIFSV